MNKLILYFLALPKAEQKRQLDQMSLRARVELLEEIDAAIAEKEQQLLRALAKRKTVSSQDYKNN